MSVGQIIIESFLVAVLAAGLSLWLFRWSSIELISWKQFSWKQTGIGFVIITIILEILYWTLLV